MPERAVGRLGGRPLFVSEAFAENAPRGGRSTTHAFTDPDQVGEWLRSGSGKYKVLGRGSFHAESTVLELGSVTLQCLSESLPRIAYHAMQPGKVAVLGWPSGQVLPRIRGRQMQPRELMCHGLDMESYHQTSGSIESMSLVVDADGLNRVAIDVMGRELRVSSGRVLRPSNPALARLSALIVDAREVARATPEAFAEPEASRALEQALLDIVISCAEDGVPRDESSTGARRAQIMARFESAVEANAMRPLYLPELCRLVGVPERTLRKCCQQHLRMSPHQYLVVRRMHLARTALRGGDPGHDTVTSIATRYGFWELGRFSALYQSLFGEFPSATLRHV